MRTFQKIWKLLIFALLLFGLMFAIYKTAALFFGTTPRTESTYSAVFLDNNQVYFGKIINRWGQYVTISDVYYFGPPTRSAHSEQVDSEQIDDVVLVKLGSEVHGPTDEMKILRDHILYIEKLSDNSRVVEAIREHKNK